MPDTHDTVRLRHIVEAGREAISYADACTWDIFQTDRRTQHSVVRCLEIMGEAAARLSAETRAQLPNIPWNRVIGMRNRLIHAYFEIDVEIIWKAVKEELPGLVETVAAFVEEPPGP